MQSRETDVKRLLFQQRRGYVGVIDIRLVRAAASFARAKSSWLDLITEV